MDNDKIIIIDEEGKEVEMEVLFTFQSDQTNKQYVLYFNPEDEQQGNVFVSSYTEDGDLEPITDESEWEMIEEVFNTFVSEQTDHDHKHDHDCNCGHNHDHDHDHECECGHDHEHDHECNCGHDH